MDRNVGNIDFPIWIIGDSEPDRWRNVLREPFDARHPIRHNIITSVFDTVQDNIFRSNGKRIETSKIFIRNAIAEASSKPKGNQLVWNKTLSDEISAFTKLYSEHTPMLILTFGAFAYEFILRAFGYEPHKYNYWTTEKLGNEFRKNIFGEPQNVPVIIPLLHRSIAGGHFIKSHENYCKRTGANYFEYVGIEIAKIIMKSLSSSDIWIKARTSYSMYY